MKKGVLLDTNIAIGLLNDNSDIVDMISLLQKDGYHFYFSVITKCELISGAKTDIEFQAIYGIEAERFVDVDNQIATLAGEIRYNQKKDANRAIKAPDSIIIATAIAYHYDLYTLDKGMWFAECYGISIIKT